MGDAGGSSGSGLDFFSGDLAGVTGLRACRLFWGRRVLLPGVGLDGGLIRDTDAPSLDVGVVGVFAGLRAPVREEDGGGMRDMRR